MFAYLGALLAEPEDRRSCWQPAERAGHATVNKIFKMIKRQMYGRAGFDLRESALPCTLRYRITKFAAEPNYVIATPQNWGIT